MRWAPLSGSGNTLLSLLGIEWEGPDAGSVIQPGATVEIPFRLFAFGPSDTLKDALRFIPP